MRTCPTRVTALIAGVIGLTSLAVADEAAKPAAGLDMEATLKAAFQAGELMDLHGVYITIHGEPFAEVYFEGQDESWGIDLGVRQHGPDTLHDLRSVTKPIVGMLYGIALDEGLVPPLDAPLIATFPGHDDLAADPARAAMMVRHALSMTMGIAWDESLPYSDPNNSEIRMENAPDRVRFILEQPMVHTPGETWTYNGGAVALVGKLIENGTGMRLDEFARTRMFDPLGITEFEWIRGADGTPSAASGLRLTQRDLAKVGEMVMNLGQHQGQQIVPEAWLQQSFTPAQDLGELRYGLLWFLADYGDPPSWVAGFGNGGQRLTVQREHGLVITVFAGRYNDWEAWRLPVSVIMDHLVPAIRAHREDDNGG